MAVVWFIFCVRINIQMQQNFLQLNHEKAEILLFGQTLRADLLLLSTLNLKSLFSRAVIISDSNNIKAVTEPAFYYLKLYL